MVKIVFGWLRSIPNTTESMQGWTIPLTTTGTGSQGGVIVTSWWPNTVSIWVGSKFWRPSLKTVYIGMSRTSWRISGRQPDAGLTPRSL